VLLHERVLGEVAISGFAKLWVGWVEAGAYLEKERRACSGVGLEVST
jgi:hypothetical protein